MIKSPNDIYREIAESLLIEVNTEILRTWDDSPGDTVYWWIPEKATIPVIKIIVAELENAQWNVVEQFTDDECSLVHCLIISERENY